MSICSYLLPKITLANFKYLNQEEFKFKKFSVMFYRFINNDLNFINLKLKFY